jgi:Mo-dependent nitrogenase C-terminus
MTASFNLLRPVQHWLDNYEIRDPKVARSIARLIPAQCPFERKIALFGHTVAHVPPLCKLNPLYEQFVGLRFRSLCYLVDQCGEDIQAYV